MKKFRTILLVFLTLIVIGCGKKDKEEPKVISKEPGRHGEALIWEVKSDTATLYLVGSIHVAKEDMYPMQEILLDAFYDSDAIAVEADVVAFEQNIQMQIELIQILMYLDGTTIEDHLSAEVFKQLEDYMENVGIEGLEPYMMYIYRPAVIQMFITQEYIASWGYDFDTGVDKYFINLAKKLNKPIIELESVRFQYEMIAGYSDRLQEELLKGIISLTEEELEESKAQLEKMYQAWIAGDAEELERILEEDEESELSEADAALVEEYNTKMMTSRNAGMVEKALEMLKGDKKIFYVVGAAHMFGESGIINQLELAGYTVTRIMHQH